MEIVDMNTLDGQGLTEAARILTDSLPLGWPGFDDAMEELRERLIPENTMLAAVSDGSVIGWGGILPIYDGHVFELHPLAVRADWRNKGVGKLLVAALEEAARNRDGLTMWIGADDEKPEGETSLAGVDLYDDLPSKLRDFKPGSHQTGFYLRLGYTIVGVVPDANGRGKPDIALAKKL